jgi:ATP phosphoribosyltransferase
MANTPGAEYTPIISEAAYAGSSDAAVLFDKFRATQIKIAIQREGELTDMTRQILLDEFDIVVPPLSGKGSNLVSVSEDGNVGFVHARNKAICTLVVKGSVDMAVVGTDRLVEEGAEGSVDVKASYQERGSWPLVIATPHKSPFTSVEQLSRVATQYPVTAERFFAGIGNLAVDIVPSVGGTELYPYLDYGGGPVDAIVDLTATGRSLAAHNLRAWNPPIGEVYPVLIQARQS